VKPRWISDETNLGLRTVLTIVGCAEGTDRTTRKRHERIELDSVQGRAPTEPEADRDALPRQVQAVIETGAALVKEAKGLGRPSWTLRHRTDT
jgi:hypothetical protein